MTEPYAIARYFSEHARRTAAEQTYSHHTHDQRPACIWPNWGVGGVTAIDIMIATDHPAGTGHLPEWDGQWNEEYQEAGPAAAAMWEFLHAMADGRITDLYAALGVTKEDSDGNR